jgi:hypothetical protein
MLLPRIPFNQQFYWVLQVIRQTSYINHQEAAQLSKVPTGLIFFTDSKF